MLNHLKFRVWHKELNRWLSKDEWFLDFDGNLRFCDFDGETLQLVDKSLYIIQQWTGLKDVEDKEIYEGDIIEGYLSIDEIGSGGYVDSNEFQFKDEIKFVGTGFWCDKADFPIEQYETLEILGNIIENPDLIK